MKVSMITGAVKSQVRALSAVAKNNKDFPAWKMLLVDSEKQTITASNPTQSLIFKVPMEANEQGQFLIEAVKFNTLLSQLDDDAKLTLNVSDKEVKCLVGKSRYRIATSDVKDYAKSERDSDLAAFSLNIPDFKRASESTSEYIDTGRPNLSGVNLEFADSVLKMTGTNGHILSHAQISNIEPKTDKNTATTMLTPDTLKMANNLMQDANQAVMYVGTTNVAFVTPQATLWSKVIDSKFPDYAKLLTHVESKEVSAEHSKSWLQSINRIKTMDNGNSPLTRLQISSQDGSMVMSVNSELGESVEIVEDIEFDYQSEILLGSRYLESALKSIKATARIFFPVNEQERVQVVETGESMKLHHVIMPMKR